jgi:hypothetical protein
MQKKTPSAAMEQGFQEAILGFSLSLAPQTKRSALIVAVSLSLKPQPKTLKLAHQLLNR